VPDEVIAGRYRLLEPLGRGAMSAVWLAEDDELQRRVAVKTLAPAADRARFEREARAAAALSHPNICGLFDYGRSDGRPFMVLEYLPGGSLEDRLKHGRLSDDETERIAAEVAAGLAHAHERGLVHRDLKPANVLFDAEGRAKIADFGIARMGDAGTLTEAGTVLGTASYISPEQAAGRPAGPASDVYSFGVILFRMLTGALPFVSTNAMELVRMHRDDPPPAVHDLRPDAPAHLERLVASSLQKDPVARPHDGRALLAELRGTDATAATMVAAAASTEVKRVIGRPPAPRRRVGALPLAALALLLLAAGVAAALVATHTSTRSPTTTAPGTLALPTVGAATTTPSATTAPTTTAPTTTHETTTHETTTQRATTAPTTTRAPTTTAAPPPTTTSLPPTTAVTPPPTTTTTPAPPTTSDLGTTTTVPTTT
jgi:serine/threonine-protein kinase